VSGGTGVAAQYNGTGWGQHQLIVELDTNVIVKVWLGMSGFAGICAQ
jgi:hypothetical protein